MTEYDIPRPFHAGLFGGALTVALILYVVGTAGVALCQPTMIRRAAATGSLIGGSVLLGWVIARWWTS